ncbi:hypothetical protein EW026_g2789 [Hermanssonia centrifuga]|uniref:Epoxide hydrolase N-terminal domain-containing protein n=1 Tax=Hermanssonia centrifuga TaxID=98765 RepID=A0A4S4KM49_9APHY|nr:hypothetical protein EW026_g2789 [Hermanssonia centrifuga]
MSSDEQPFTLSVSQDTLDTLAKKLALATLPCPAPTTYTDSEDAQDWTYGVPSWREHEQTLNALPQFTRSIEVDGHGVFTAHYVHKKSEDRRRNAIPLLFLHGWPGHFNEASKLLPLLTAPPASSDYPAFDVVVPSLPGFGFSSAPTKTGFALPQYAEASMKLYGHRITRN